MVLFVSMAVSNHIFEKYIVQWDRFVILAMFLCK